MATKVIDVSIATIRNTGSERVSPEGNIWGRIVRAVNDDEIFQSENIYNGGMGILPGQSLTIGVNKRLTVHHFGEESPGHLNQMLVFQYDLKQRYVVLGHVEEDLYFGSYSFKVRFDDIAGFQTFSVPYNTTHGHKIEVVYTVNLVASN
ncbi:hypothetical protein [Bacillus cereus group sp. BfR-BA-01347]|uniref:hypothetical protein n=1 Tax=Bacillus cereus group sp. BfR-BA-01347 TaxID=2920310 RepID=UPI001F5991B1|nr:hypothetical protein [Bacillus cereus group sp. BfR-BA-01347]